MTENGTVEQEARQPELSVGATLRAEREARGLSVEEIAERVKYSVRQVDALENDDAEHLPQGTFLRGFVRSYARVLGMDESKLLAATHTQTEHHFDVTDVQAGGAPLPRSGVANRRSHYLMFGALAVAILLVVFVWTHREDATPPVQANVRAGDTVDPASAVSLGTGGEIVAAEPAVPLPSPDIRSAAAAKPVPSPVPSKQAKRTAPPEAVEAIPSEVPVPPTKSVPLEQLMKRPIHIVFTETAWMEIVDVNGEVLLSRITQAGEEKWIGGADRAPYRITIGRPAALRMYYHGNEIDLSGYNPAAVAKLVLE